MVLMEVSSRSETKSSSGYGKPPWIFKGSALYQLHLVKAETARAFIPKDFKLVEAFGYTLGGFFLASYEDSPAGPFDELVILAGIVWNPPTSCAWAAKVLVSSEVACEHGRKDVGLPSQVARFSKKTTTAIPRQRKTKFSSFLDMLGFGPKLSSPKDRMDVRVTEIKGPSLTDICNIDLTTPILGVKSDNGMMPTIKISLPSFSGRTVYNPNLLKYTCRMECRLRAVTAAKVSGPCQGPDHDKEESLGQHGKNPVDSTTGEPQDDEQNLSISVMLSKPILALEFGCLKMQVEAPVVISKSSCRRTPLEVS